MEITKENLEQYLYSLGLTLGITFGQYSVEVYPSNKPGNYGIHFNCDVPNLMDTLKQNLVNHLDVEILKGNCHIIDMEKIHHEYETKFKYQIGFKVKNL